MPRWRPCCNGLALSSMWVIKAYIEHVQKLCISCFAIVGRCPFIWNNVLFTGPVDPELVIDRVPGPYIVFQRYARFGIADQFMQPRKVVVDNPRSPFQPLFVIPAFDDLFSALVVQLDLVNILGPFQLRIVYESGELPLRVIAEI